MSEVPVIPIIQGGGQRRGSLTGLTVEHKRQRRASIVAVTKGMSGQNQRIKKLLEASKASDLGKQEEIVELTTAMSPIEGFKLLLAKNILSAPVWDQDSKAYTGFLDVRDLVASCLHVIHEKKEEEFVYEHFLTAAVTHSFRGMDPSIKYLSKRNPFKAIKADAPLIEAAELMRRRHCHRVPVVDAEGKVVQIVSQSNIVDFLVKHKADVGEELKQTLKDINVGFKAVKTILDTDSAKEAFDLLVETQLSGIGVVDSEGTLIGNTSASDIKAFVMNATTKLSIPILDYLAMIRQEPSKTDKYPVSAVKPSTTLERVLGILSKTNYHRLFIENEEGKPIGVISISDILLFALKEDQEMDNAAAAAAAVAAAAASS